MKENIGCVVTVIVGVIMIIISPALCYFFGWITGVLLKWTIGDTIVNGMNYLFNTTRFTVDMLPTACGTLGVVGSFFKTTSTSTSSKN